MIALTASKKKKIKEKSFVQHASLYYSVRGIVSFL